MAEDSIVDVNNWGLTKTIDWLEENNVSSGGLQSLDQLHDLVRAEMDKEKKHGSELFNKVYHFMHNDREISRKVDILHTCCMFVPPVRGINLNGMRL